MGPSDLDTILSGRAFLEAPRWRDGRLYVSAMYEDEVLAVSADGSAEVVARVGVPSGLGWRPDGTFLVVAMEERLVHAVSDGEVRPVADLSGLAAAQVNDMVVGTDGRAYVTQLGSDLTRGAPLVPAPVLWVDPDGSCHAGADRLANPNGVALTPDGRTLVVAEHRAGRLTALDVEPDGTVVRPRCFAQVGGEPDGLCLDAEGAAWCGLGGADRFVRVLDGGQVVDEVATPGRHAVAVALGGPDGRTLFLLTAETTGRAAHLACRTARIEACTVDVPGVGRP